MLFRSLASAGTNIKVLEAMAMGKAIVSTPAGVNGLNHLIPGVDFSLASDAVTDAQSIDELLANPTQRNLLEQAARRTVEAHYNWDVIADLQAKLYQ